MHNNNVYIQIMIGGTPNIPFWTKAPKIKRLRVSSRVTFNIMRMFLPPPRHSLVRTGERAEPSERGNISRRH